MRKIGLVLLVALLTMLPACGKTVSTEEMTDIPEQPESVEAQENHVSAEVISFIDKVDALENIETNGLPTLTEVTNLKNDYYNFTEAEKEQITNFGIVMKYLNLDLDTMHEILDLNNSSTYTYSEAKDIIAKYEALTSVEQEYIVLNQAIYDALLASHDEELAIAAINFIKQYLKNPESFVLNEAAICYSAITMARVNFSAANGYGGMVSDTFYINVENNGTIGALSSSADVLGIAVCSASVKSLYSVEKEQILDTEKLIALLSEQN